MTTATPTKSEVHKRFIELDATEQRKETFQLSFSSETPVERGFHQEVLSHAPAAVNLKRLNDSAPLLCGHDPKLQIDVIERAWIENGRADQLLGGEIVH